MIRTRNQHVKQSDLFTEQYQIMWGQKIQNAVLGTKNLYLFKLKNNSKSVSILLRSQTVFFNVIFAMN